MRKEKIVWIIEDSQHEIELLESTMHDVADCMMIKMSIIISRNGKSAIDRLAGSKDLGLLPDLIITDLDMPTVSGFDFIDRVKKNPFYKEIPIVIFSSLTHPLQIKHAAAMGANGYVVKPFGLSALEDTVKGILHFWLCLNQSVGGF